MARLHVGRIMVMVALVAVGGCRRTGGSDPDGGGPDQAVTAEPLTPDEQAATDEGNGGVPALQQLVVLADTIFDFDPTLDPAQSDAQNADNIVAHVGQDGGTSCVAIGRAGTNGTSLTFAFGPPPGCTLPGGTTISGSVTVVLSKVGSPQSPLSVALGFDNVVVNGQALSGNATFTTYTGTKFTVDANVTAGSTMLTATALTVSGGTGTITVDGDASIMMGGDPKTTLTFTGVKWLKGECYPSAGTLKIRKGLLAVTITFTASTPTTGMVSVSVGPKTSTASLPVYGSCGAGLKG